MRTIAVFSLLALVAAQSQPNRPGGASSGQPGGASSGQQSGIAGSSSIDGTWTVVYAEINGKSDNSWSSKAATIRDGMLSFSGEGNKQVSIRLEFGPHHSLMASSGSGTAGGAGTSGAGQASGTDRSRAGGANTPGTPISAPAGALGNMGGTYILSHDYLCLALPQSSMSGLGITSSGGSDRSGAGLGERTGSSTDRTGSSTDRSSADRAGASGTDRSGTSGAGAGAGRPGSSGAGTQGAGTQGAGAQGAGAQGAGAADRQGAGFGAGRGSHPEMSDGLVLILRKQGSAR